MIFAPSTGGAFIRIDNDYTAIFRLVKYMAWAKCHTDTTLFTPFAVNNYPPFRFGLFLWRWFGVFLQRFLITHINIASITFIILPYKK
jgi:hypothetical protein